MAANPSWIFANAINEPVNPVVANVVQLRLVTVNEGPFRIDWGDGTSFQFDGPAFFARTKGYGSDGVRMVTVTDLSGAEPPSTLRVLAFGNSTSGVTASAFNTSDVAVGGLGSDVFRMYAGEDYAAGGGGNDTLSLGDGFDTASAGAAPT